MFILLYRQRMHRYKVFSLFCCVGDYNFSSNFLLLLFLYSFFPNLWNKSVIFVSLYPKTFGYKLVSKVFHFANSLFLIHAGKYHKRIAFYQNKTSRIPTKKINEKERKTRKRREAHIKINNTRKIAWKAKPKTYNSTHSVKKTHTFLRCTRDG